MARSTSARIGRGTALVAASATLVAASLAIGPSLGGAQSAGCASPHSPGLAVNGYPAQESLPDIGGTVVSTPIDLATAPVTDSDGDGVPDVVNSQDGKVSFTRGDGKVLFARAGAFLHSPNDAVGDLDGDGRDELTVAEWADGQTEQETHRWVVPGTTAPGTYDPAVVGVEISLGLTSPVADRTGDGAADVVQWAPSPFASAGSTRILSGAAIASAPAGTDLSGAAPAQEVQGILSAFADLGGALPALVTAEEVGSDTDRHMIIRVVDGDDEVVLTTQPDRYVSNYTSGPGTGIEVRDTDSGTYLVAGHGDRSGNQAWVWRIDDPCGAVPFEVVGSTTTTTTTPAGSATPEAPAAQPTTAAADFTG